MTQFLRGGFKSQENVVTRVSLLATLATLGVAAADPRPNEADSELSGLQPVNWGEVIAGADAAADGGVPRVVMEAERRVVEALFQADIERHKREGLPDVRVDDLPAEVRTALRGDLGLTTTTVPPETFYSARFQAILAPYLHLFENEGVVELDLQDEAVREALGPYGILFSSPPVREAWLERPGDQVHVQAAVQSVLSTLPQDIRRAVATGFDVHIDGTGASAASGSGSEFLPTEDALAQVSVEARQALADYRHLLGNRGDLIHALAEMPPDAKCAVREFLRVSKKPTPIESLYSNEQLREIDKSEKRGYFHAMFDQGTPAGARLFSSIQEAIHVGVEPAAFELEEYMLRQPTLPTVPAEFLLPDSLNYVLPSVDSISQIYSKSLFGGMLHVEAKVADAAHVHHPTLTIAGRDANVLWTRYDDGKWTTSVGAFDGSKAYRVAVQAKLEGDLRGQFVAMARNLIEDGFRSWAGQPFNQIPCP